MSNEEKEIIERAVKTALCFGSGVVSNAKLEIEDYGFIWTLEHEEYTLKVLQDEIRN